MKEKQGNLAQIGLPKLLNLIYRKGEPAAVLDIVREPIKKRFFFKNGIPVAASSNILNEVLGRLLMQEGIITQKQYETSLEIVLKEKKKHGEVLISMGYITPEQLNTFLTLQLKRRLWKIFGWNEGSYRYTKAASVPRGPAEPLHPAYLILEGISLGFYPVARIRADIKDYLDKPLAISDPSPYRIEDFRLNLQEKRLLESFDGIKTLKEVLEGSDLLRHRALSIALSLIITGVLKGEGIVEEPVFFEEEIKEAEVVEAGADTRLNAELLFMKAKSALQAKDYSGAVKMLTEITNINPLEGEYWGYLGWAVYNEDPGEIKKAEKIIKDAIDLNNDLDSAWYFLGMVSVAAGDLKLAEKSLRTAISKNPWMLDALSEVKRLDIKRQLKILDEDERKRYAEFFGFSEDPFNPAPDPKFLTLSAAQTQALDGLFKCVRKKAGPLLLSGVDGSGKTTLALELLKKLSNDKILSAMVLDPPEKELEFIKAINAEIGAVTESPLIKEQLLSLGMRVSQNKIQGGHTVLIIDRAERLTHGCLKLIQYLSRLKTLQIFLIAGPSLETRLKGPEFSELDQKLTSRFFLNPFTAEETLACISNRLNSVRKPSSPSALLSREAVEILYIQSKGVPAEINVKGAELLKKASDLKTTVLDKEIAEQAFGTKRAFKIEEAREAPPVRPQKVFANEEAESKELIGERAFEVEFNESVAAAPAAEAKQTPTPAPPAPRPQAAAPPLEARKPKAGYATFEKAPEIKSKNNFVKLILWVIVMLIAGLVVGSLIGIFWFNQISVKRQEKAPAVAPAEPRENQGAKAPEAGPLNTVTTLEGSAPADGSLERPGIEGSNNP